MPYSEVIVVPGASGKRGIRRLAGALYVYREEKKKGFNPLLIFSGYDYLKDEKMKCAVSILSKNFPIIVEPNSTTTRENAFYASELVKALEIGGELRLERIFVVTDTLHYGRAKRIFSRVFDNPELEVVEYARTKEIIRDLFYEFFAYTSEVLPSVAIKKLISLRNKAKF